MAEPNLFDFTQGAPAAAKPQPPVGALDIAKLLLELRELQNQNPLPRGTSSISVPSEGGMTATLPYDQMGPADDVRIFETLRQASPIRNVFLGKTRLDEFLDQAAQERDVAQLPSPAERVMARNKNDVSPVRMSGGVAYDRFARETDPFLGFTPAEDALARQRDTAASENVADTAAARALTRQRDASAARTRALPLRPRVKAMVNGKAGYYDAYTEADGSIVYRPAVGADGVDLVAPSATDEPTAFQRNTEYEAAVRGISPKEVLEQARKSGVTPALVRDVERDLMEGPNRAKYRNDPEALKRDLDAQIQFYVDTAGRRAPGGTVPPPKPTGADDEAEETESDAPPPGIPAGARQAQDGFWYVQKEGKWFRVVE